MVQYDFNDFGDFRKAVNDIDKTAKNHRDHARKILEEMEGLKRSAIKKQIDRLEAIFTRVIDDLLSPVLRNYK
ncbi:MAG: hypothetical protein GF397_02095, partial [Elusimicrobia bacterium]|nr:hypothetical protein [Elusimicrobiota bacterium]